MRWDPLQRMFLVYPGGGSGGQTTTNQMYSPEEAARRAAVMQQAESMYGQQAGRTFNQSGYDTAVKNWLATRSTTPTAAAPDPSGFWTQGAGTQPYPGSVPVGASADTIAAQNKLRDFSTGQGQQASQNVMNAMNFGLHDVLYPGSNPALQATIDTATRKVGEAYTDPGGVMSQIRSNFISGAPSGHSTRENIAEGIAGRNYLNTIGDVTGQIASKGYETGLDHVGRTMALSPSLYNLGQQPALTQSGVGQQVEQYGQQQEDYLAASRNWATQSPWDQLKSYADIVFGGGSSQTTATSDSGGVQPVQRAGMALGGASLGYMIGAGTAVGGPYGAAAGAALGILSSFM